MEIASQPTPESADDPFAAGAPGDGLILDPNSPGFEHLADADREAIEATIKFFEERGKVALTEDAAAHEWYADYLDFQARERIFSRFLTPVRDGEGDPERRWDTQRICAFNEVSAFYGLAYWYTWQVTILGLGPIFQSDNEAARAKAAKLLEEGGIFAFGLSERAHGADIYSTDMVLTPDPEVEGGYRASGGKYYIGNGNKAAMVSVFGRVEVFRGQRQMTNPVLDVIGAGPQARTGRIVAIYPQSDRARLSTWELGEWIAQVLRRSRDRGIDDPVPAEILDRHDLISREEAYAGIHAPTERSCPVAKN